MREAVSDQTETLLGPPAGGPGRRLRARTGPAAIAVHDDGHMLGRRSGLRCLVDRRAPSAGSSMRSVAAENQRTRPQQLLLGLRTGGWGRRMGAARGEGSGAVSPG